MAEQEYERLQTFFFRVKPLEIQSKQTESKELDEIKLIKELELIESTVIRCAVCGGKYTHFNKNRHCLTKKHQSFLPTPPCVLQDPQ